MQRIAALVVLTILAHPTQASQLVNIENRPVARDEAYSPFAGDLVDSFRWMEDPSREADVKAWLAEAGAHARAQLDARPEHATIAARNAAAFARLHREASVREVAGIVFRLSQGPSDETSRLIVRNEKGRDRTLFTPKAGAAINSYAVSPDGGVAAVHLAEGGRELGHVIFVRVKDGHLLSDEISNVFGDFAIHWVDESTVAYTASSAGRDPLFGTSLVTHRLAGLPGRGTPLLAAGDGRDPKELVSAAAVSERWFLARIGGARPESRYLVAPVHEVLDTGKAVRWREITSYSDQAISAAVHGDAVFYISTKEDKNGALHIRQLDGPQQQGRIVKAPADIVLRAVVATRSDVYVLALEDGIQRLFLLDADRLVALSVPGGGSISEIEADAREDRAIFSTSGWLSNRSFQALKGARLSELGIAAATRAELGAFEVRREEAISADGTRVPLTIMARKGPVQPGPTIVEAYAAYGVAATPDYFPPYHGWLESGGTYAICHARGGGERGRLWHEAGRHAGKVRGQDDLIACGERLLDLGYARNGELGALGGSAGGLVVAPAAVRRPDLFSAVVLKAALLNPTRLLAARNGPNQYAEFGDPTSAAGFGALKAADAYVALDAAKASPDWFLAVGLNDQRVEPWMSAKFAAKALKRFGDSALVFARTDAEAGHGIGTTASSRLAEMTDAYIFMLDRLKPKR